MSRNGVIRIMGFFKERNYPNHIVLIFVDELSNNLSEIEMKNTISSG